MDIISFILGFVKGKKLGAESSESAALDEIDAALDEINGEPADVYTVTYDIGDAEADTSVTQVTAGESYETVVTFRNSSNVVVTMGGVDITDSCVSITANIAQIHIESVTGNIVITATTV